MFPETTDGKRMVYAPDSYHSGYGSVTSVLSVLLAPDEEVDWTWYYGPDGSRSVVGYTIRKKLNTKADWK